MKESVSMTRSPFCSRIARRARKRTALDEASLTSVKACAYRASDNALLVEPTRAISKYRWSRLIDLGIIEPTGSALFDTTDQTFTVRLS